MAQQIDPEAQASLGRLLGLVGEVFREIGSLISANATDERPPVSEAKGREIRATIDRALDTEFGHLFGAAPGDAEGSDAEPADTGPSATPDGGTAADPAGSGVHLPGVGGPPTSHSLHLVCRVGEGPDLAIPWHWVVDTHLSQSGSTEAVTISDGVNEKRLGVREIVGLLSAEELADRTEQTCWLTGLDELPNEEVYEIEQPETGLSRELKAGSPEQTGEPPSIVPAPASDDPNSILKAAAVHSLDTPSPRRAWIVSPSALARRFLMRHLDEAGLDVGEARDLDDPLLPADLESAGALFLDESLLEQWKSHPAAGATGLPLVLLTVDGALQVPPEGDSAEQGAVLPRPFERSEVESIVGWLRSHWQESGSGGSKYHGDQEDDTWLFADPFGTSGAGKRPGGG